MGVWEGGVGWGLGMDSELATEEAWRTHEGSKLAKLALVKLHLLTVRAHKAGPDARLS